MTLKPFSSPTYRRNTLHGETGEQCCLCGRDTLGANGAIHVPVNHEAGEFVTKTEVAELGDKLSLYPIGPECAKRWAREFDAESCRIRTSKGRHIHYDHQPTR